MLLSKEVRDTQPNPRYSAKNNDAIRMIASFMPILFTENTLLYPCSQKKLEKNSKKKKTQYTILPYNRRFSACFLAKKQFRFFLLKIHYYIDHQFSKIPQKKTYFFLKPILVKFDAFLAYNKA